MTKIWTITEKTIGTIQILWGAVGLVLTIWGFKQFFDVVVAEHNLSWENISIIKLIGNHHYLFILPLLTMFAGVTLLLNKRIGWIMSIVTSLLFATAPIFNWPTMPSNELYINDKTDWFLLSLFPVVFLTIFGLLLTNHFRKKYNPTRMSWLIILGLLIILLIDKIFLSEDLT